MSTLEIPPTNSSFAEEQEDLDIPSREITPDIRKLPLAEYYGQLPDLPKGYGYVGGAARAIAQYELFGEEAPIRDIDIIGFKEFNPDPGQRESLSRRYMPDDYKYGHGVYISSLDNYFETRDFTINEVAGVDHELYFTEQSYVDLKNKVIRPCRYDVEQPDLETASTKLNAKAILMYTVFQAQYGQAEIRGKFDFSAREIDDFHLALTLHKALQYGPDIASDFIQNYNTATGADLAADPRESLLRLSRSGGFHYSEPWRPRLHLPPNQHSVRNLDQDFKRWEKMAHDINPNIQKTSN